MNWIVSVVIPTYNRSGVLRRAIESVLAQTIPDLELIVVDHASTDSTPKLLRSYGDRIKVITLKPQKQGGPAYPRNTGLNQCSAPLIAFLDDDDFWEANKLEMQVALLEHEPETAMTSSNARTVDADGRLLGTSYLSGPKEPIESPTFERLVEDNFVITSSVLARSEVLRALGGFGEDSRLHLIEDYHLWLRVRARYPIHYSSSNLVNYTLRNEGSVGLGLRRRRRALNESLKDPIVRKRWPPVASAILRDTARLGFAYLRGQK